MSTLSLLSRAQLPLELRLHCFQSLAAAARPSAGAGPGVRAFHATCLQATGPQRRVAFRHHISLRHESKSSRQPVTFFNANLKSSEAKWQNRADGDLEKSWLTAHLRSLADIGKEKTGENHPPSDVAQSTQHDQIRKATAANAELTLDETPPEYSSDAFGPAYRDLIIRCTTFDSEGNVVKHSEPVAKSSVFMQHGLQPRDLRKIDSRITNVIPTILIRKESILLNILHIRMLIKCNTVILVDAIGTTDSALLQSFQRDLTRSLRAGYRGSGGLPYEFRALETALSSVSNALEEEMNVHRDAVEKLIGPLETHIVPSELRKLLQYTRQLSAFAKRAKSVQAALDEVLEQDDDLSKMYLSENQLKPREDDDHQEVEMLLESFSKQIEETVNEADSLVANVQQTQDVIELILDSSRNSLLTLDLQASIATMGLGTGAFIAGLFGMNLHSSLESTPYVFWLTSGIAFTVVLAVTLGGLRRVHRLRRIGLGQGVFGEYHPAFQNQALADIYGRKALYHERSRRKRLEKQERDMMWHGMRGARSRT